MENESRIKYESDHFYIYMVSISKYEIRKNQAIGSTVVGTSNDLSTALRVVKKLELYPNNV